MNRPKKSAPRELPTRETLDAANSRHIGHLVVGIVLLLLALSAWWWARHGLSLVQEWAYWLETLHLYWTLVATPRERQTWMLVLTVFVLGGVLLKVLFHRFVWRAFFPDLYRLDPRAHPGGRPEPIGRLYRIRAYRDGEHTRHRHYYKHGHRSLPLFRFDVVDLDTRAEPFAYGAVVARCGRLERDATAPRFKRLAAQGPYASQPLEDTFRVHEVVDDQERKTSIVGPGPGMNPDVMRRKWHAEPSMIPELARHSRNLAHNDRPSQTKSGTGPPEGEQDA